MGSRNKTAMSQTTKEHESELLPKGSEGRVGGGYEPRELQRRRGAAHLHALVVAPGAQQRDAFELGLTALQSPQQVVREPVHHLRRLRDFLAAQPQLVQYRPGLPGAGRLLPAPETGDWDQRAGDLRGPGLRSPLPSGARGALAARCTPGKGRPRGRGRHHPFGPSRRTFHPVLSAGSPRAYKAM